MQCTPFFPHIPTGNIGVQAAIQLLVLPLKVGALLEAPVAMSWGTLLLRQEFRLGPAVQCESCVGAQGTSERFTDFLPAIFHGQGYRIWKKQGGQVAMAQSPEVQQQTLYHMQIR